MGACILSAVSTGSDAGGTTGGSRTLKIVDAQEQALPGIHRVRFGRFNDHRGYFTETFRRSDFEKLDFLRGIEFLQCNESYSEAGVVRGLHFQWNPHMGKLVRTIQGRMIDLVLDIRQESPSYGKAIAIDLPASPEADTNEWLWVPPGFAHGNFFPEPTTIEYFCSGEYSPGCEAGISPLADDIDWSLCDPELSKIVREGLNSERRLMTDKDRDGFSLAAWGEQPDASEFVYGSC